MAQKRPGRRKVSLLIAFGARNVAWLRWRAEREETSVTEIVRELVTHARNNDDNYTGDLDLLDASPD